MVCVDNKDIVLLCVAMIFFTCMFMKNLGLDKNDLYAFLYLMF